MSWPFIRAYVLLARMRLRRNKVLLCGPDGVDPAWYRKTYPDIGPGLDPVEHYALFGWREGRSPNANFSSAWYRRKYSDVAAANIDPLLHFLRQGRAEGRRAVPHAERSSPDFPEGRPGVDGDWYRARYGLHAGTDAVAHYVEHGWREGKDPNPDFSTVWYLCANPDIAAAGMNPLLHYLDYGRREGRTPKPSLLETARVANWWLKLSSIAAAMYATAYQLNVPLLSLAPLLLLALSAMAVEAIYVSLINDLSDRSEDLACGKRNGLTGKTRGTVAALLACCLVPGALFAFYWRHDAALIGLYLAGWAAFSAYSLPPVRLKRRGIWGVIADASGAHLFPTLLGVVLVYRGQTAPVDPVWLVAVAVWSVCYGLRGILWHQLTDRDSDARIAVRTFAQAHGIATLRRLAHGVVFPCEVAALGCMLWLIGSALPAVFLALYLLLAWSRPCTGGFQTRPYSPLVIVVPRGGKVASGIEYRLAMFRYYEVYLPLALLLASALRYPADLLVAAVHVAALSLGTLGRVARFQARWRL
jgi:hypothetical protein